MIEVKQVSTPNQVKRKDIYGKTWIPDIMVYHLADGFETGINWMQNPASNTSSHFFISAKGIVTQLVPLDMAAYTQGLKYNDSGMTPMPKQAKSAIVKDRAVNPNCYTTCRTILLYYSCQFWCGSPFLWL